MRSTLLKYLIIIVLALALAMSTPLTMRKSSRSFRQPTTLRCVLDLKGEPVRGLTVGMNKIILREFADDNGLELQFIIPTDSTDYLDSLREGKVDLLVMYRADSLHRDGLLSTLPYRDSTVWVLREDQGEEIRLLNAWISEMNNNGGPSRFGKSRSSRVGISLTSISAYDDIVKKNAAESGWDWRLLSAIIYHESRFHNESCSIRGAIGLMQILDDRFSVDTLLDPAVNIALGTGKLTRMANMFSETAADSLELLKFVLAAYNAGQGSILRCVKAAEDLGVDPSYWDNLVSIMPEIPGFQGAQTIAYVREVLDTYEEYSEVYPPQ